MKVTLDYARAPIVKRSVRRFVFISLAWGVFAPAIIAMPFAYRWHRHREYRARMKDLDALTASIINPLSIHRTYPRRHARKNEVAFGVNRHPVYSQMRRGSRATTPHADSFPRPHECGAAVGQ